VEQLVDTPLPRAPVEVGVTPHWLLINGVQPAIPENAPIARPQARRSKAAATGAMIWICMTERTIA
jgi:transcription initiation factor TFIID subunit 6